MIAGWDKRHNVSPERIKHVKNLGGTPVICIQMTARLSKSGEKTGVNTEEK